MDTSETYIKMSEKAEEIQKHNPAKGDYYAYLRGITDFPWAFNRFPQVDIILDPIYWRNSPHIFSPDLVENCWLPRQDQLQEMLEFPTGLFKDNFWNALADLYEWSFSKSRDRFKDFIPLSMEQIWLCYVMEGKYNKVWNSESWIIGKVLVGQK